MPWSNTQKQIAARACRAAGLDDEYRLLILRQFDRALFDAQGGRVDDPTSTSAKLTHADFEQFMAIVEAHGGGQVLHFSRGYWQAKADDPLQRVRNLAERIAAKLEAVGALNPGGAGLAGWIEKRVTDGRKRRLIDLDYHELRALIGGLRAYAVQRGVEVAA